MPGTSGPEHHRIIAARAAAEARGGTPGGGYVTGPGVSHRDPLDDLAEATLARPPHRPPHTGLGPWQPPPPDPGSVTVTRIQCSGCGRLGHLAARRVERPDEVFCDRCDPDRPADPPPAPPTITYRHNRTGRHAQIPAADAVAYDMPGSRWTRVDPPTDDTTPARPRRPIPPDGVFTARRRPRPTDLPPRRPQSARRGTGGGEGPPSA